MTSPTFFFEPRKMQRKTLWTVTSYLIGGIIIGVLACEMYRNTNVTPALIWATLALLAVVSWHWMADFIGSLYVPRFCIPTWSRC